MDAPNLSVQQNSRAAQAGLIVQDRLALLPTISLANLEYRASQSALTKKPSARQQPLDALAADRLNQTVPKAPGARPTRSVSTFLKAAFDRSSLLTLGFARPHIARMANHYAPAATLQAVVDTAPALLDRGFTHADIVKVASNDGAAKALAALLQEGPRLVAAGYSQHDIVRIANNDGAAQSLPTLLLVGPKLFAIGFSREDVVKMASNVGAAKTLPALLHAVPKLIDSGFSQRNIVKIASNGGAFQAFFEPFTRRPQAFCGRF
jgi:hypothetical protein